MPFIPNKNQPTDKGCPSKEHQPPSHMVFPDSGTWVCPCCGEKTHISIPNVSFKA